MRSDNRDDPMLWINRAKNDYYEIRDELCTTGSAPVKRIVTEVSSVTAIRKGILLTLCRYAFQDGEHLLIPVNRDEAAGWNVPLSAIFNDAISNTSLLFPPVIYDIRTSEYIHIPSGQVHPYIYDDSGAVSAAAEDAEIYSSPVSTSGSGLRLIVSTSPASGDTPLLYPGLLLFIGKRIRSDPTILICEPGKLFVFEGSNRSAIEGYISRYRDRFGESRTDPRIYKYFRKNRILLDNSAPEDVPGADPSAEKNIPRGSVASAWGDMETRNKLLEWKKGLKKRNTPFT